MNVNFDSFKKDFIRINLNDTGEYKPADYFRIKATYSLLAELFNPDIETVRISYFEKGSKPAFLTTIFIENVIT